LMVKVLPPFAAGIFLAAPMAAIMSTINAQLLQSSATIIKDLYNLAREDIVWHSVSELITDVPDKEMLGLNIVEFAGDDEALIDG
ncbi:hypothetical protein MJN51_38200, partial [Salmonella enterica subsp. enterica serovar Kentucky]|nr:hypothetical protein [Salmonella enterica subsp. enterica serovar Kentucky]